MHGAHPNQSVFCVPERSNQISGKGLPSAVPCCTRLPTLPVVRRSGCGRSAASSDRRRPVPPRCRGHGSRGRQHQFRLHSLEHGSHLRQDPLNPMGNIGIGVGQMTDDLQCAPSPGNGSRGHLLAANAVQLPPGVSWGPRDRRRAEWSFPSGLPPLVKYVCPCFWLTLRVKSLLIGWSGEHEIRASDRGSSPHSRP